jgi:hypothetical protein
LEGGPYFEIRRLEPVGPGFAQICPDPEAVSGREIGSFVIASTFTGVPIRQRGLIGGQWELPMIDEGREIKRRYQNSTFRTEKLIAVAWLTVFALLVGASIYNKIGRPALDPATSAVAADSR